MTAITAAGIPCFSGSCSEIYREKAFVAAGLSPCKRLPVARRLGETSLMFLVHPTLTDEPHRPDRHGGSVGHDPTIRREGLVPMKNNSQKQIF